MSKKLKYRILELMQIRNISAMQMATKCQVHVQSVYKWGNIEQDDAFSMPADKLKEMADIFEISMEDIYTKSENSRFISKDELPPNGVSSQYLKKEISPFI